MTLVHMEGWSSKSAWWVFTMLMDGPEGRIISSSGMSGYAEPYGPKYFMLSYN